MTQQTRRQPAHPAGPRAAAALRRPGRRAGRAGRQGCERGSVSLELAALAPAVILLVLLTVAAMRITLAGAQVDGAARDAARAAVPSPNSRAGYRCSSAERSTHAGRPAAHLQPADRHRRPGGVRRPRRNQRNGRGPRHLPGCPGRRRRSRGAGYNDDDSRLRRAAGPLPCPLTTPRPPQPADVVGSILSPGGRRPVAMPGRSACWSLCSASRCC